MAGLGYLKDPNAIYERSFQKILNEVDLSALPKTVQPVALRMIHACGMPDIVGDLQFDPKVADAAGTALARGATIFADCEAVSAAISRSSLPAGNEVLCTLNDPRTAELAKRLETTRSAAAVPL
ncbi:MAG: precorrin-8X methylmutase, partial [Methyloligellaceae bacterium]